MEGGNDVVSAERASRQGESRFKRATANLFYRRMGRVGDVSTPRPAISAWSIARRSDGRATASGDIELAGGDRSRRWPGGFERMGAGGQPVHARSHCHRAHFALYRREARPDGPVAQRLEPAAHNGLVAGSSPARPTTLFMRHFGLCRYPLLRSFTHSGRPSARLYAPIVISLTAQTPSPRHGSIVKVLLALLLRVLRVRRRLPFLGR
jgi:hypothetical protein